MTVEIDGQSGFCGGVIRAIGTAERYLGEHGGRLLSLGAIVHNEEELSRLESLGLVTVDSLEGAIAERDRRGSGEPLFIRAHGEPPQVYTKAEAAGFNVIDCTCPVVLRLQKDIRDAHARVSEVGGQIILFGKQGHPEVLGLVGQVSGDVTVVSRPEQLLSMLESHEISLDKPTEVFSQTTMSPDGYQKLCELLRANMPEDRLKVHETICSQVAHRHRDLAQFAREHDVIVFVAGTTSSNGKVLCDLCRSVNERTYHVGSPEGIDPAWFREADCVGVCGATSTPKWLLEKTAQAIENLH